MSYRPITDTWILCRPKLKGGRTYYGAYPAGFLQRARDLLGCGRDDPVLHVCGGMARFYPYKGFGPFDRTLDLDPETSPDYFQDARIQWPVGIPCVGGPIPWAGILIDPPYSPEDAGKYRVGAKALPTIKELLTMAVRATVPGIRVGILHYLWARPVPGLRPVAIITVAVGCNNRLRAFSVFEREEIDHDQNLPRLQIQAASDDAGPVGGNLPQDGTNDPAADMPGVHPQV